MGKVSYKIIKHNISFENNNDDYNTIIDSNANYLWFKHHNKIIMVKSPCKYING